MTPEPLLDLSTLAPVRPVILIDGEQYEIAVIEDFGAVELFRVQQLGQQATALGRTRTKDYTEQTAIDISENLSSQIRLIVLDMPDEVLIKLTDQQKAQILSVFSGAAESNSNPTPTKPPVRRRNPRTGATSSPASSDSMGVTPEIGST